jgi:hypothetical protein
MCNSCILLLRFQGRQFGLKCENSDLCRPGSLQSDYLRSLRRRVPKTPDGRPQGSSKSVELLKWCMYKGAGEASRSVESV